MKLRKRNLAIFFFFAWGFLISLPLLHLYSGGDQVHYTAYYDYLANKNLLQAYLSQHEYLGSSELVYPLIAWIGSNLGLDKVLYFSFWNATLLLFIGILLLKHNASATFIFLTLFNFYLFVLLTGAERLKFAYIFLLLAALTQNSSRLIMIGAAIASHLQALITTAALMGFKATSAIRSLRSAHSFSQYFYCLIAIVSLAALSSIILLQLWESISAKLAAYKSISRGAEELYQIAALTLVGILTLLTRQSNS